MADFASWYQSVAGTALPPLSSGYPITAGDRTLLGGASLLTGDLGASPSLPTGQQTTASVPAPPVAPAAVVAPSAASALAAAANVASLATGTGMGAAEVDPTAATPFSNALGTAAVIATGIIAPGSTAANVAATPAAQPSLSLSSFVGSAGLTVGVVVLGIVLLLFAIWPHSSTVVSVAKTAAEG